jgi:hypothetical protein
MDEHDDDLESVVHEDAEEETDSYPDTGDELDQPMIDDGVEDEAVELDEDETEI